MRIVSKLRKMLLALICSSFLIGKTGKIEYVWPLVKAKGHPAAVLEHISQK